MKKLILKSALCFAFFIANGQVFAQSTNITVIDSMATVKPTTTLDSLATTETSLKMDSLITTDSTF